MFNLSASRKHNDYVDEQRSLLGPITDNDLMEKTIEFLLSFIHMIQRPKLFRDRCCQRRSTNDTDAIPGIPRAVIGLPSMIDRPRPKNSRALFNTDF